jgi:hypothetical protein
VRSEDAHWARTLQSVVEGVAEGLGVTKAVAAQRYKPLVYDEGSLFVEQHDSGKAGTRLHLAKRHAIPGCAPNDGSMLSAGY